MEPLEYLQVMRRRWRLLAACVLVAAVAAWITTPANPSNDQISYRATNQLIRDTQAVAPTALASLSVFVKTGEVPRRVAERIGYTGEPALLAAGVTLEADDQVGTLAISASGSSPTEAADLANAFAEETLGYLGEQAQSAQQDQLTVINERLTTLQSDLDALDNQLDAAESSGSSTGVIEAERDSKLRQYGAALDQQEQALNQPPPSAGYVTLQEALPELARAEGGGFSAPRSRAGRTGLAVVLGLFLGLVAVLLAERLDTRLNTREATEEGFRLPVIAEVPRSAAVSGTILSAVDPLSSTAEAFRTLRASLMLMPTMAMGNREGADHAEPHVIVVTSPSPGDGKTTTVANLAACFGESGRSVLVLGCDFRRPEVHHYFNMDNRPGIADVLVDGRRDLASVVRATGVPGVSVAPSGSSLRSLGDVANAGRALVSRARELADIVIIDTPPILATNDATELIPAADAVVVVARVGKTSLDGAKRTHRLLERLSAPAAGVVLVGVGATGESSYADYYTSVTPEPTRRRGLLRRWRHDDLADRIQPWRAPSPEAMRQVAHPAHTSGRDGAASSAAAPRPTEATSATGGVPGRAAERPAGTDDT
jgi:capsular exopolysaccharide synthesis family protein